MEDGGKEGSATNGVSWNGHVVAAFLGSHRGQAKLNQTCPYVAKGNGDMFLCGEHQNIKLYGQKTGQEIEAVRQRTSAWRASEMKYYPEMRTNGKDRDPTTRTKGEGCEPQAPSSRGRFMVAEWNEPGTRD